GAIHQPSDLIEGAILLIAQDDHTAVIFGQLRDSGLNSFGLLTRDRLPARCRDLCSQSCACALRGAVGLQRLLAVDLPLGGGAEVAAEISEIVVEQAVEPSAQFDIGAAVELREVALRLQECLLN